MAPAPSTRATPPGPAGSRRAAPRAPPGGRGSRCRRWRGRGSRSLRGGDEPFDCSHVEVRLDEVGKVVELRLPGRGEGKAGRFELLAAPGGDCVEERNPEG